MGREAKAKQRHEELRKIVMARANAGVPLTKEDHAFLRTDQALVYQKVDRYLKTVRDSPLYGPPHRALIVEIISWLRGLAEAHDWLLADLELQAPEAGEES